MGLRAAAGNSRLAAAQHVSSSNYRHYTVYCVTRREQMGLGAAAGYSRSQQVSSCNYRHYTVYCVTRRGQMGLGAAAGYSRLAAATIANVLCHKT